MGDVIFISFDSRPVRIDATWGFEFTRPDGTRDHVSGFLSEEEAATWLANGSCKGWARPRGYVCSRCNSAPTTANSAAHE